jgi:hypothetical protein
MRSVPRRCRAPQGLLVFVAGAKQSAPPISIAKIMLQKYRRLKLWAVGGGRPGRRSIPVFRWPHQDVPKSPEPKLLQENVPRSRATILVSAPVLQVVIVKGLCRSGGRDSMGGRGGMKNALLLATASSSASSSSSSSTSASSPAVVCGQ